MSNPDDFNAPVDPLLRLASFRPPRDLTLGGMKPNKKVFVPNLNVARKKNSATPSSSRNVKKEEKVKRDHRADKSKHFKSGPKIVQTTGIFSEGLGSVEGHHSRVSFVSRSSEPARVEQTLQKPTLKVEKNVKIDYDEEEQKIREAYGADWYDAEPETFSGDDAPVRLPPNNSNLNQGMQTDVITEEAVVTVDNEEQFDSDNDDEPQGNDDHHQDKGDENCKYPNPVMKTNVIIKNALVKVLVKQTRLDSDDNDDDPQGANDDDQDESNEICSRSNKAKNAGVVVKQTMVVKDEPLNSDYVDPQGNLRHPDDKGGDNISRSKKAKKNANKKAKKSGAVVKQTMVVNNELFDSNDGDPQDNRHHRDEDGDDSSYTSRSKKDKKKRAVEKAEVVVKEEPLDSDDDGPQGDDNHHRNKDRKPVVEKMFVQETELSELLKSDKPKLMLVQLPDILPGRSGDDGTRRRNDEPSTSEEANKPKENGCRLRDLKEGRIGTMRIHRSGKVTMYIGDTLFDVTSGITPAFRQEVVSVAVDEATKSATIISLGDIEHKLDITPNWDSIFEKMSL